LGTSLRNWLLRISTDSQSIAVVIVVIALFAALGSWRASVWAGRVADFDQRAAQELIVQGELTLSISGTVAHNRRLFAAYQTQTASAGELEREAKRLRHTDPRESRARYMQAQRTRAVAETARLELGSLSAYSPSYEMRWRKEANSDLQNLRPGELHDLAEAAQG
jgi:hypothetical protein